MKRNLKQWTLTGTALLVLCTPAFADHDRPVPNDRVRPNLVPVPTDDSDRRLKVDVWTRQGDGAVLTPGQRVDVFFRTKRDAYVVVYNIDTRGRARLLFPQGPYDDGFVEGRRTVAIPGPNAGYRLRVTGPAGVERIVALASNRPLVGRWREFADADRYDSAGAYRGGRRSGDLVWSASASVGNAGIRVAGSKRSNARLRPAPVRPRIVPVPVRRGGVFRDETWFRVARARAWWDY